MRFPKFSLPVFLFSFALMACSSEYEDFEIWSSLQGSPDIPELDPEFVARAEGGAPLLIVSVENRENAFSAFALQTENEQGVQTWISGDGLSLGTRGGFVIATRGFGNDLMAADVKQVEDAMAQGGPAVADRFMTLLNGNDQAVTFAFRCQYSRGDVWPIDLGGGVMVQTRAVFERCKNANTSFENTYWTGLRSNQIIQSRQWISPQTGHIATRVTRLN